MGYECIVITGATDGIGKEFALQLAKAGFNILLVSRNEDKLRVVAGEIGLSCSSIISLFSIHSFCPGQNRTA